MRRIQKWLKIGLLIFLVLMLLPFNLSCGSSSEKNTVITSLQGEVSVKKAGTIDWAKAEIKMLLNKGDSIKTGAGAGAKITFFDGSTIELNADTQIEFIELLKEQAKKIRMKQEIGETVSKVEKLVDSASKYEIVTPTAIAGVRGSSMRVSVSPDGTTQVQNLEGKISITAQGVEVLIPEGSSSTVLPGQPPSPPQPVSTVTSDPANDLFDNQNKHVTGEGYQDILGNSLVKDGDMWVWTINLNDNIPSSVPSNIFMEWDLMIDSDLNAKTGWNTNTMYNDTGADYYINFYVNGERTSAGGFLTADTAGSHFTDVQYKVTGKTVEVRFPTKRIGNISRFNYLVLTRKYDNSNQPSVMLGADKYPDQGHLEINE
jgi:hypothetical protein